MFFVVIEPPATFWHQNNVERSKAPQTRGRMCFFLFWGSTTRHESITFWCWWGIPQRQVGARRRVKIDVCVFPEEPLEDSEGPLRFPEPQFKNP